MNVSNATSINDRYQSILKAFEPDASNSGDYADAAQSVTTDDSQTASTTDDSQSQPVTQQDIKDLLQRLAGLQPTLIDFLNSDSDSTSGLLNLLNPSGDSADSANSNNALASILNSFGSALNPDDLSALLETAYSGTDADTDDLAPGQIIDQQN